MYTILSPCRIESRRIPGDCHGPVLQLSRSCSPAITGLFSSCHGPVLQLSRSCSPVVMVLFSSCHHGPVLQLSRSCSPVVTVLFSSYHGPVLQLSRSCSPVVTVLFSSCHGPVLQLSRSYSPVVTVLLSFIPVCRSPKHIPLIAFMYICLHVIHPTPSWSPPCTLSPLTLALHSSGRCRFTHGVWKRLEHQCRKTQLTVHRDMFTCQRNKVNTMCAEAKKTHYKEKLSDIRSHAQFYNIANKLLHRRKTITLPNYECAESLANKFADHFDEKIQPILTTLQTPHSCAIDCTVCKSP